LKGPPEGGRRRPRAGHRSTRDRRWVLAARYGLEAHEIAIAYGEEGDLAVRHTTARTRLAGYVFHYWFSDLIERYEADTDFFFFRNRGSARVRGVELEGQIALGESRSSWRASERLTIHGLVRNLLNQSYHARSGEPVGVRARDQRVGDGGGRVLKTTNRKTGGIGRWLRS